MKDGKEADSKRLNAASTADYDCCQESSDCPDDWNLDLEEQVESLKSNV